MMMMMMMMMMMCNFCFHFTYFYGATALVELGLLYEFLNHTQAHHTP
jgi:hypothetical protein